MAAERKAHQLVHEGERLDDLHRAGLLLIQNPKSFCFGVDAVFLSDFAKVHSGETALDLGTGNGVIPILLTAKSCGAHYTGLEIQEGSVSLARRSVLLNNLQDKVTIDHGDIKEAATMYKPSSFDVVTSNPPYIKQGGGVLNNAGEKSFARHETLCTFEDVAACGARLLRPGGRFYVVHRPHRLSDIFAEFKKNKLEPKTLRFIHPRIDKEPVLVLVEAVRGGKPMLKVPPPLVIYGDDGEYTKETYNIYYR